MDTGVDTADVDASDMDTSSDIDTRDVPEDIPEDDFSDYDDDTEEEIPEDTEEDDMISDTEDEVEEIPEDIDDESVEEADELPDEVPEDTFDEEANESDDSSDQIAEDKEDDELTDTDDDFPDDIPEDIPDTDEEMTEGNDSEVDEQPVDTDETITDEAEDAPSDMVNAETAEQPGDTHEANDFNNNNQDNHSKVLKCDELDLLKSGNDAINQRLEAQADDYRDKGMSEDEIKDRLVTDKWNFQKEFLEDAFPGEDVSPNVFNGLSDNRVKDRINETPQMKTHDNQALMTDDSAPNVEMSEETDSSNLIKDLVNQNVTKAHLPSDGHWENSDEIGNSKFIIDDTADVKWNKNGKHSCTGAELKKWMQDNYAVSSVKYDHNEPDFSPFSDKKIGDVIVEKMGVSRTGENGTFSYAEEIAAEKMNCSVPEVRQYMKDNELTWHECADRHTIMAVPTRINAAFKHSGGISVQKSVDAINHVLAEQSGNSEFLLKKESITGMTKDLSRAVSNQQNTFKDAKRNIGR